MTYSWDVVILSLSFLFLQLERDSSNGSSLNSSHQVSGESSDFVSQSLRWDDRDFVTDLLVGVEIESESGVELLDNYSRGSLDGFSTNSSPVKCVRKPRLIDDGDGDRVEREAKDSNKIAESVLLYRSSA
jgi:hypothetical protein